MRATVWLPDGAGSPGRLAEVGLVVDAVEASTVSLGRVSVTDRGPGLPPLELRGDLCFDPCAGGGPLQPPAAQAEARAFGVVNAAFHLHRALAWAEGLLGRSLPPVKATIGAHHDARPRWAGGHYRLPARTYKDLAEESPPAPTGEVHLGTGGGYLRAGELRYFDAPAHNQAIIIHEFGHHLTRHTADFRLNRARPRYDQVNRKIPLDEGTADYVAAVLLGTPDIYGWHRQLVPSEHPARRRLGPDRTMASFTARDDTDPHVDGGVWASALWSARRAAAEAGHDPRAVDRALLVGLDRLGAESDSVPRTDAALWGRRELAPILETVLDTAGGTLGSCIEAALAAHGVVRGLSNTEMRDAARLTGRRSPVAPVPARHSGR